MKSGKTNLNFYNYSYSADKRERVIQDNVKNDATLIKSMEKHHFESKKELHEYVLNKFKNIHKTTFEGYYLIGVAVNGFYKKAYGKGKIKTIAGEMKISENSLYKACNFAKKYTAEQVAILASGKNSLSWNYVSSNLTIDAELFVEYYTSSENMIEFKSKIDEYKKAKAIEKKKIREIEGRYKEEKKRIAESILESITGKKLGDDQVDRISVDGEETDVELQNFNGVKNFKNDKDKETICVEGKKISFKDSDELNSYIIRDLIKDNMELISIIDELQGY